MSITEKFQSILNGHDAAPVLLRNHGVKSLDDAEIYWGYDLVKDKAMTAHVLISNDTLMFLDGHDNAIAFLASLGILDATPTATANNLVVFSDLQRQHWEILENYIESCQYVDAPPIPVN